MKPPNDIARRWNAILKREGLSTDLDAPKPEPKPEPIPAGHNWPSVAEIGTASTVSYSRATLAGWGIPWPAPTGWRKALLHQNARYFDKRGITIKSKVPPQPKPKPRTWEDEVDWRSPYAQPSTPRKGSAGTPMRSHRARTSKRSHGKSYLQLEAENAFTSEVRLISRNKTP
ncbi:hypothetical protein MKK50_15245 [Methylobacterium sp. J-043]|nr:hypothetical protein [Methylobacterium sp. J-043]